MMSIQASDDVKNDNKNTHIKINPKEENVISICGVVVFILPEKREEVEAKMLKIKGLEIHGASEEGKLVVTIETDSYKDTGESVTQLQKLEGILSLSMIYQHAEALNEEPLGNAEETLLENNLESI